MKRGTTKTLCAVATLALGTLLAACGGGEFPGRSANEDIQFGIWQPDDDGAMRFSATVDVPNEEDQAYGWRVRVPDVSTCFHDRIHGDLQQNLAHEVGDFIVRRADGLFAYQLAVVVDDAFQGITHVVRGADLLWNTPRQIHLQNLLGLPTPIYAHVPLITNAAGQKLSKQTLAPALPDHKRGAVLAQALAALGHPPPAQLVGASPAELLKWASTHWQIENVPLKPTIAKSLA